MLDLTAIHSALELARDSAQGLDQISKLWAASFLGVEPWYLLKAAMMQTNQDVIYNSMTGTPTEKGFKTDLELTTLNIAGNFAAGSLPLPWGEALLLYEIYLTHEGNGERVDFTRYPQESNQIVGKILDEAGLNDATARANGFLFLQNMVLFAEQNGLTENIYPTLVAKYRKPIPGPFETVLNAGQSAVTNTESILQSSEFLAIGLIIAGLFIAWKLAQNTKTNIGIIA